MSIRQRNSKNSAGKGTATRQSTASGASSQKVSAAHVIPAVVIPAVFDFYTALALVFGGCSANVLVYEQLLLMNPRIGSALTFSQMLFISLHSLPSFLIFSDSGYPRLKPREVPIERWALQVLVLTTGSLLNNWAYAYKVPLTVLIVFRSGGLPISMLFGYLFSKKRYTPKQILSVMLVFAGVVVVTLSRVSPASQSTTPKWMAQDELRKYFIGITMMIGSLFCTGLLGFLQEKTYQQYGPCWRESVFYTHFLALPVFLFLGGDVKQGILSLSHSQSKSAVASFGILLGNLVTQLLCVSGVNQLSSHVSSVSTNIALTARKALSLCLSVWWFGNEWNAQLALGAIMVFFGSLLYAFNSDKTNKKD